MASTKKNEVPVAPFSLIGRMPMQATEASQLAGGYFKASGKVNDPEATRDPNPCPLCGGVVAWAWTKKTPIVDGKLVGVPYVYARCVAYPDTHRWAFKAPGEEKKITLPHACKNCPETFATFATPEALKAHAWTAHGVEILLPYKAPERAPEKRPDPIPTATPPEAPETMTTNTENPFASVETFLRSLIEKGIGVRMHAAEEQIAGLAGQGGGMSPDAVKAMVEEAMSTLRKVSITIPTMPEVKFEGRAHPMLARVLKLIAAGQRFFLLCGPAATGKSTIAGQVAEALKAAYAALSITQTMQREDLLGCRAHNLTDGTVSYRSTPMVDVWEKHGVICLDEVDRGDANTLTAFNSIEQDALYVPRADSEGGPLARSSKAIVIATANTYGTGANRTYVGANQLDAAFLDRFFIIDVGYDHDLEVAICGGDELAKRAVDYTEACRKRLDAASVRRPMTTRMIRRAVLCARIDDLPVREALVAQAKGWSAAEISTVFQ